ncbi:hypothetical protein [Paenibacillus sp. IHBB 10380]|uniref:hypothetical protein n=1 Tax=Paenibacillus sp. IHBB 10380 TaxID=1566358 RepID=UPI0005CFDCCF|nr:hypothetical protein [Paenibacillus sp. IHBB 10380]AJS57805.1 hypothetical protein UB51_04095 [Paenibacillus sp. IHBB 10380]
MDWKVEMFDWEMISNVAVPFIIAIIAILVAFAAVRSVLNSLPDRLAELLKIVAIKICLAAGAISYYIASHIWESR